MKRYFLDQDSSGHWYIVPVDDLDAWEEWTMLSEDDEQSWDPPPFAQRVGGAHTLVTFTDPKIG
jgi:hypothetical protein